MKVILSHPTSNQFNRALVKGLYDENMLYEFHTAIASFPNSVLDKLSSLGPFSDINRRSFDPVLKDFTHSAPLKEVGRMLSPKLGLEKLTKHEEGIFSVDAVYRALDKKVKSRLDKASNNTINAVYAYEDGALQSFEKAKKLGLRCLYDLPIGYWRTSQKLLQVEVERWPEWATTLTGMMDSEEKLGFKDRELELADEIFVASTFTQRSLDDYPGKLASIQVIPYGFPTPKGDRKYDENLANRKLKLLFVGGLSQRKGIADVIAVADTFKDAVTLTVVGRKATEDCAAMNAALARHTWIPSLSHNEVLALMEDHDVLLFPSLFEGFGMVITEAMSRGTPVITTDRTAGPNLIEHGKNGWLIEAASTAALENCVKEILDDPSQVVRVGSAALKTASQRSWSDYGKELAKAINAST